MKTGILYFTTCFHGFGILRHVDPFVRMLHKSGFPTLFLLADLSTFLPSYHQYPSDIVKRLVLCTGVKSTAPQAGTREKTCDHQLNYNYDTVALSMITR